MRRLAWAHLAGLGVVLVLSGCKSKASQAEPSPGASAGAVAQPGSTGAAATATQGSAAAATNSKCPAGRWSYDYSDQALETLMKNVAGAKVVKKEGSFICDISEGAQGTVTCATQGKPVLNVVEANQAGMKMLISVTIDGKATTNFTLHEGQRMNVVSSDISGLKISTDVTLGGKKIPFPTDKLISIFGKPNSTMSYKCEGGNLMINSQPAGAAAVWQRLEPAK